MIFDGGSYDALPPLALYYQFFIDARNVIDVLSDIPNGMGANPNPPDVSGKEKGRPSCVWGRMLHPRPDASMRELRGRVVLLRADSPLDSTWREDWPDVWARLTSNYEAQGRYGQSGPPYLGIRRVDTQGAEVRKLGGAVYSESTHSYPAYKHSGSLIFRFWPHLVYLFRALLDYPF